MSSPSRERARARSTSRSSRAPAIWRGGLVAETAERPVVQHGSRGGTFTRWRLVSGGISAALVALLVMFFAADAFYVRSIAVGGLTYTSKEEIFALADIAETHVFWIDPAQVRQNILRSPTIADARVTVGWPPTMVQIIVEEREPALVWEQAGVATWLDLGGRVMRQRENRPDLMRVVADNSFSEPLGPNDRIPAEVVIGALQLRDLKPQITVLRYNRFKGLGFQDGAGWEAWFGDGTEMQQRVVVYDALVANLVARGIQPGEVNVVNRHAPFYTLLFGSGQ